MSGMIMSRREAKTGQEHAPPTQDIKTRKPHVNPMTEFSKQIVKWLCFFWFFGGVYGLVIGGYAIITEIATLGDIYRFLEFYIGVPLSGTLVGYLAKAGFENGKKILKESEE